MDDLFQESKNHNTPIGLMSLDIATETGYCTSVTSGTWKLGPKKDESKGMRLIRFKGKLKEVCDILKIKMIVFEQVAMYGKFPNLVAAEMVGVLKLFCEENSIEYKSYPPTVIKKFGTGKGNANKDMMVQAAQKYKPGITSDDEADAVILYHFALEDLKL